MKSIQKLLFAVVVAMGLSATHVLAEEAQQSTAQASAEVQIKDLEQKIKVIQAQIDELKDKGDLTSKEKLKLIKLNRDLIAFKDSTIASEKAKQAAEKEKQAAYDKVLKEVKSIKQALPASDSSR